MDNIKILACKTLILRPIDSRTDKPIWLICDASASGIGGVYGQGLTWETCRPAGFMSKKFTAAQHNYRVFEMETITILKGLIKWEDKLIGNKINIVTDHRALEFCKTQRRPSSRQSRWIEYLSRFDFDIQYVKGSSNKVADSLSRYYQSDTNDDVCQTYDYVNADLALDQEGEDLPWNRVVEIHAIHDTPCKRPLHEAEEERGALAKEMAKAMKPKGDSPPPRNDEDPTLFESLSAGPELTKFVKKATAYLDKVRAGYNDDLLFVKILKEEE